ncbi:MAG TPA: hypothetical protein VNC78_12755 [Actinomycetota bacterium]|nr:hypothetical protein [Actinomycetota bacterium]
MEGFLKLRGGRTTTAVLILTLIAAPAAALRVFCVGGACDESSAAGPSIPFCSLPEPVRRGITAGFYEGRSPDILAVTRSGVVVRGRDGGSWPSLSDAPGEVPVVFWGHGVDPDTALPDDMELRDVAPTIATLIGLERPHPEVRSGLAVADIATGEMPRLVIEVVWKGGAGDLEAALSEGGAGTGGALRRFVSEGATTLYAGTGSLPADPAALLTTLGTGGHPAQHGITGSVFRDQSGQLVLMDGSPPSSVIATLADDLDEVLNGQPVIGLVTTAGSDAGIIGGDWYLEGDKDITVSLAGKGAERRAPRILQRVMERGFGRDTTPDLLVVIVEGELSDVERAVDEIYASGERVTGGEVAIVVTATPSESETEGVSVGEMLRGLDGTGPGDAPPIRDMVAASVPGGLFLDRDRMASAGLATKDVVAAVRELRSPAGTPLFADVFPQIAVAFGEYC